MKNNLHLIPTPIQNQKKLNRAYAANYLNRLDTSVPNYLLEISIYFY